MKKLISASITAAAFVMMAGTAHAEDPKASIAKLDAMYAKLGEARVDGNAEKAGELSVPALYFGNRKINNNNDVVDEFKKSTGATATVFVKSGEDYVRISTNVLTPEGKRGVGTKLARAATYESMNKGVQACSVVDVLGTKYDACYNPIKDKSGAVIGVTYIGFKQ